MDANGARKRRGRPGSTRADPTMRWIANKGLWDAVAIQCGITSAAVRSWKRVPPLRVIAVERATGRPRHLIRPDLHPTH